MPVWLWIFAILAIADGVWAIYKLNHLPLPYKLVPREDLSDEELRAIEKEYLKYGAIGLSLPIAWIIAAILFG